MATLVVRLIAAGHSQMFQPDRMAGDRTSTSAFDVHYALKGLDKSPSVACVGITSNLPGKRADLLIADDIRPNKNGLSATQRAQLLHLSRFSVHLYARVTSCTSALRSQGFDLQHAARSLASRFAFGRDVTRAS